MNFSVMVRRALFHLPKCRHNVSRYYGIWEPDYLILGKTKTPEYDLINVQIRGFDFVVLEKYQRLIHKIANLMSIDVEDTWATPHQDIKVQKFFPKSSKVEYEYNMKMYERNIQIVDAKSNIMALFIEAVLTACPPGIKLNIHEHTPEIEENRYVPDYQKIELEKQLEELEKGKLSKKKKF